MLYKKRMRREIVGTRMLQYKKATGTENGCLIEHLGRYGGKLWKVVRRVGKDKIEFLATRSHKTEYVTSHGHEVVVGQLFLHFEDKIILHRVFFYAHHSAATARQQLETDGSRTGKEVECREPLEIETILEYIEQILACKVGRGTCLDIGRDIETATPVFSSYNSHNDKAVRSKGNCMASLPMVWRCDGNITGPTVRM